MCANVPFTVSSSKDPGVSKLSHDLLSMGKGSLRSSGRDQDLQSRKQLSDDSDDADDMGAHGTSPGDQAGNDSSCQTPSSSQGASGPRSRTLDGKPIPFRGLSRNPRLQLALIKAVHSFKPFGYGNVKNGWKKVQEHMNAHKLMDAFEKDGVRHELSWQLCRDVFSRILDEWKISGRCQTKMDGIEIHDVEQWNELVLEIYKKRQKQESLDRDDKKRGREEDGQPGTPIPPSAADLGIHRQKFLRIDPPTNNVDTPYAVGGGASSLVSVFSPRVGWAGAFPSLAASDVTDNRPATLLSRVDDLQRSQSGQSIFGAHIAQARTIENAAAELLLAQNKVNLQNSLLQTSALNRVGGAGVATEMTYSPHGGFGLGGVTALAQAQQRVQQVQQQVQTQAQVLRDSFHARAHMSNTTSAPNTQAHTSRDLNPSSPEASQATTLERILAVMERQAEDQRALREVAMRTMQSLENVVKTVASLACDVADLASDSQGNRRRFQ